MIGYAKITNFYIRETQINVDKIKTKWEDYIVN